MVSGGVSNVSFSFRGNEPVREAMHAVFLYHAIQAGMDMGIVNAGQLAGLRGDSDATLRERVEDVVLNRRADATERLLEIADDGTRARPASGESRTSPGASGRSRSGCAHALVKGIDRLHRRGHRGGAPQSDAPARR